jgi:2-(3-amino-3-carboxypropyl)histidine synthase
MEKMSFDLEENRLKEEISKRKPKIVLLQLPEGLKKVAPRLAAIVEGAGAIPVVSGDPCYGACDLAIYEAKLLGANLIIHYGHTPMTKNLDVSTVYFEVKSKISVNEAVTEALPHIESWNKIGLVTTIQHVHQLDKVKNILENVGKTVFIGDAGRVKYPGQVLGCDFSNAQYVLKNVDAYLFIGGGRFHAIGLAVSTGKPTIIANPYEKIAYPIHDQVKRIIMQRWVSITAAKKAKNFGILVTLKSGQTRLGDATKIKGKLENNGFIATLLALREVTPSALMQFSKIDAFINTGCPRVSLDDGPNFSKPLLSINETLVMLGEMTWEELLKSGWFGSVI